MSFLEINIRILILEEGQSNPPLKEIIIIELDAACPSNAMNCIN